MKKRLLGTAALGLLAAFLLYVAPARAQTLDQQIEELKQRLAELEQQQIELRKEATEAAPALPTFSYRPGNGVLIEAADKSWSFRASQEMHLRMSFLEGRPVAGRTRGEIGGRRWRPEFYYCINNCLYEMEVRLDLDGFATGSGRAGAQGTAVGSILQRAAVHFNLDQINPFLPTVDVGMDVSTTGAAAINRQGSAAIGAQAEYDMWSRDNSVNTGRAGQGINLRWDNKPLFGIGRIARFSVGMASINEADDGLSSFRDQGQNWDAYLGINPFSAIKNKWIEGLHLETGAWFCRNREDRGLRLNANLCLERYRFRDHGFGQNARQALWDTGAGTIGDGWLYAVQHGIGWGIGPVRLRGVGGYTWDDGTNKRGTGTVAARRNADKRANVWLGAIDLFLWSPKGFLTGSAATPGSVLFGYHYEVNRGSCRPAALCVGVTPTRSNRITLHEWDLWYFLTPRMSIGGSVLWYDARNLSAGARNNLGIRGTGTQGGDWVDFWFDYRYQF